MLILILIIMQSDSTNNGINYLIYISRERKEK